MPAPILIYDPKIYGEPNDPRAIEGDDPIKGFRNFLTISKTSADEQPSIDNTERSSNKTSRYMEDISTSPRLLGYVFSCISSALAMITATVFYVRGTTVASPITVESYARQVGIELTKNETELFTQRIDDMNKTYHLYFGSGGSLVQQYKVYGAIAVSGLLTLITLTIVIAHFDSILCVKKNRINFRDGSKVERNLILFLLFLSVIALHINTSKFSVGEAQANVYFSTWINFVSCAANYEVWRKGSGRRHTFQKILFGKQRHWFLLAILATIACLSTIDFFVNNNIVQDTHNLRCLTVSYNNKWIWLSAIGSLVCWFVLFLQRYAHRHAGNRKIALINKITEAIVALGIIGCYGYVVASFTGGRLDHVQCPSNLYFSVWGAFFLAVWILSTQIQQSRDVIPNRASFSM